MRSRVWLPLIMGVSLACRLGLAWLPLDELIVRTLPDDAFIYFVIARHLGEGLGATFDGTTPTNGFHPLWALTLTPIFAQWPSGDLPIRLAASLGALSDTLAGGLAYSAVKRASGSRWAGLISCGSYLFNPRLIFESVNGLETGLAQLMLAAGVLAFHWSIDRPDDRRRALVFGITGGGMALARSDLAIIYLAMLVPFAIRPERRRAGVIAALMAGAAASPWLIWNQLRFGTMVQSSAVAIPSLALYRIQQGLVDSAEFGRLWTEFLLPVLNLSLRDALIYPGVGLLTLLLGAIAARWRAARGKPTAVARIDPALYWPLYGALAIVFVHTLVRWYPRGWYFAPLSLGVALLAGPWFQRGFGDNAARSPSVSVFPRAAAPGPLLIAVALGLGLIAVLQTTRMLREPEYRAQAGLLKGAEWIRENTSAEVTVGALNAGIVAYFSERTVINLDGLVDWQAIRARRSLALLDYFESRGGEYLVDHDAYVWGSFGPFLGADASRRLTQIASMPVSEPAYGPVSIYRIARR